MRADLLRRLSALLRKDAADPKGVQFDLGFWAAPSVSELPSRCFATDDITKVKLDCGTTACAMGLAALSGEFSEEGLTCMFQASTADGMGYALFPQMLSTGAANFDAAAQLFELTFQAAQYLFDPEEYGHRSGYRNPDFPGEYVPRGAVGELFGADRIDAFIDNDGRFDNDGVYSDGVYSDEYSDEDDDPEDDEREED